MTRQDALNHLAETPFDLLVIGGGITGAGIVRDAALRGLRVALIDQEDFASGTSSRSSKLIHGGLRYLEHGELRLVFEGVSERALLLGLAPHLVKPLEFLLPSYTGDWPSLPFLDLGLWMYDALSKFSAPRRHRTVLAGRTREIEPGLREAGLKGGVLYYDCMTDDARLTLENILDARALGATAVNHARADALTWAGDRVSGAVVRDLRRPDAQPVAVRARVVVNATGPWCDTIRRLAGETPLLGASKGVHLVFDASRLPVRHAVVMKKGARVVFCIPWGDRTVLGTTDTFFSGDPGEVWTSADDVRYLLELANGYFPAAQLTPHDVLATWAGVRPLVRPEAAVGAASDVSREHRIVARPGLVSVAGGKLTTYRRMAAEVVEEAGRQLARLGPCETHARPLPGGVGLPDGAAVERLAARLAEAGRSLIEPPTARLLAETYGARAEGVLARMQADPALARRLDPELPHVLAQVDVAIDEEQAETVDDVLSRRVPLLLRARDQGLGAARVVTERMAQRLGWSAAEARGELGRYERTVALSRRFRGPTADVDHRESQTA